MVQSNHPQLVKNISELNPFEPSQTTLLKVSRAQFEAVSTEPCQTTSLLMHKFVWFKCIELLWTFINHIAEVSRWLELLSEFKVVQLLNLVLITSVLRCACAGFNAMDWTTSNPVEPHDIKVGWVLSREFRVIQLYWTSAYQWQVPSGQGVLWRIHTSHYCVYFMSMDSMLDSPAALWTHHRISDIELPLWVRMLSIDHIIILAAQRMYHYLSYACYRGNGPTRCLIWKLSTSIPLLQSSMVHFKG